MKTTFWHRVGIWPVMATALFLKIALLMTSQSACDGDEAVVGMMAKHMLEGKEFLLPSVLLLPLGLLASVRRWRHALEDIDRIAVAVEMGDALKSMPVELGLI